MEEIPKKKGCKGRDRGIIVFSWQHIGHIRTKSTCNHKWRKLCYWKLYKKTNNLCNCNPTKSTNLTGFLLANGILDWENWLHIIDCFGVQWVPWFFTCKNPENIKHGRKYISFVSVEYQGYCGNYKVKKKKNHASVAQDKTKKYQLLQIIKMKSQ